MSSNQDAEIYINKIVESIRSNTLSLPSKPDMVATLQDVVNDPNVTVKDVSQILIQDPALTARVIRLSNSPILRGKVSIVSIDAAVNRLGVSFVCNLSIGFCVEQAFKSDNKYIQGKMSEIWRHLSQVAGNCSAISKYTGGIPVDLAMLGGILHDIGSLSILTFASKSEELIANESLIDELLTSNTASISQDIMRAWEFPSTLIDLPVTLYNYYKQKEQADLSDALLAAKLIAVEKLQHPLNELDRSSLPCFKRLNIDPQISLMEYPELKEMMDSSKNLFL